MRNGTVIVGGTNVYTTYGAYISKGGYKELLQWPALKTVSGNDWQEEDGFEPDLSNPRLNSREFSVTFSCIGGTENLLSFYDFLLTTPKTTYTFQDIGLTLTLRVVSAPSARYCKAFGILPVKFACDTPPSGSSSPVGNASVPENDLYVIDGRGISEYGIIVNKGTIANSLGRPDVKPLLYRNTSVMDGAEYDENPLLYSSGSWVQSATQGDVTTRAKDFTLKCTLLASSTSAAWANYYSLLTDLIKVDDSQPDPTLLGARSIVIRPVGGVFLAYYKSNQVEDLYFDGTEVMLRFSVTLCLFKQTGTVEIYDGQPEDGGGSGPSPTPTPPTPADDYYVLGAEGSDYVITEDGKLIRLIL